MEEGLIVPPVVPVVLLTQVVQRYPLHGVTEYKDTYGWLFVVGAVPVSGCPQSVPDKVSQLAAQVDDLPLRFPLLPPQPREYSKITSAFVTTCQRVRICLSYRE